MKVLSFITLCFFCGPLLPMDCERDNSLLKCLGHEEVEIHISKQDGPHYRLNQELINLIKNDHPLRLKEQYCRKLCNSDGASRTVKVLEASLTIGKDLFILHDETLPEGQWKNLGVDNLMASIPHIYMNYLSSLKLYFGDDPSCLDKYIPEIVYLQDQIRDLETEVSREFLLSDYNKKKVHRTFDKLLGRKTEYDAPNRLPSETRKSKINLAYIIKKCSKRR